MSSNNHSNNSSTFSSSSSYSFSSSSSSTNGQTTGHRAVQQSQSGPNGTTVTTATQNLGEPVVHETRRFDTEGRQLVDGGNNASGARGRIEDVSDEQQAARDQQYLERMEDEYAKREGGA